MIMHRKLRRFIVADQPESGHHRSGDTREKYIRPKWIMRWFISSMAVELCWLPHNIIRLPWQGYLLNRRHYRQCELHIAGRALLIWKTTGPLEYPSKLWGRGQQVAKLPVSGRRQPCARCCISWKKLNTRQLPFTEALNRLRANIAFVLRAIPSLMRNSVCDLSQPKAWSFLLCVVEDSKDVMAVKNGSIPGCMSCAGRDYFAYRGIGPGELKLIHWCHGFAAPGSEIREIIPSPNPTMEGDTTAFYLHRKLKDLL